MPVTGTNPNGNFQGLKAENATVINLRGVKVFEDDKGQDLFKLIRKGGSGNSSEFETILSNVMARLDTVEKFLQNLPPTTVSQAPVSSVKGPKGDKGDKGEDGESVVGPQGPRGKNGVSKFSELLDVNMDGLDDGAVPMWSSKDKKWVMSLEE